jgi:hypothetical protein
MKLFKMSVKLLLGLNGVDAGLTMAVVHLGLAREMNPAMAVLLRIHPTLFLVVKMALLMALTTVSERQSQHAFARYTIYFVTAMYTALIVYSVVMLLSIPKLF